MIEWNGGPMPVDAVVKVEYVLRNGEAGLAYAGSLRWEHSAEGSVRRVRDVVGYRLPALIPAAEADPLGKDPHEAGAKLDAGKNRLGLVLGGFAVALEAVGRVGTYGANKYTPNGWKAVPNGVERYTDALYRHMLAEERGERVDPDTQIEHAAHAAWNALARLDLLLREAAACSR